MKIRKFEMTEDLAKFTNDELEDEAFADDINRLLPLEEEEDVIAAFEVIEDISKHIPYKDGEGYNAAEKLYVLDRMVNAATIKGLKIEDLISRISLGGEDMTIDKNSEEFKQAVQAQVLVETEKIMAEFADKDKRAAAKKELEDKVKELLEQAEGFKKDLETIKAEKLKAEEDFAEYKSDVETKAKIRERIDALKSVGLELSDWAETEEAVADMSDKAFKLYQDHVTELIKAKKHMSPEEQKKMQEEQKKKEKMGKTKASTDIVIASQKDGDLPNGEIIDNEKEFPLLTKWLDADYGTKVS